MSNEFQERLDKSVNDFIEIINTSVLLPKDHVFAGKFLNVFPLDKPLPSSDNFRKWIFKYHPSIKPQEIRSLILVVKGSKQLLEVYKNSQALFVYNKIQEENNERKNTISDK